MMPTRERCKHSPSSGCTLDCEEERVLNDITRREVVKQSVSISSSLEREGAVRSALNGCAHRFLVLLKRVFFLVPEGMVKAVRVWFSFNIEYVRIYQVKPSLALFGSPMCKCGISS